MNDYRWLDQGKNDRVFVSFPEFSTCLPSNISFSGFYYRWLWLWWLLLWRHPGVWPGGGLNGHCGSDDQGLARHHCGQYWAISTVVHVNCQDCVGFCGAFCVATILQKEITLTPSHRGDNNHPIKGQWGKPGNRGDMIMSWSLMLRSVVTGQGSGHVRPCEALGRDPLCSITPCSLQ